MPGIAIASRFFAVGALCPHAQSGAGALSTQALMNPLYGKPGLAMLASGKPAPEVLENPFVAQKNRGVDPAYQQMCDHIRAELKETV